MATGPRLRKEQYTTADNFKARIYLNSKFRTHPYPWPVWLFDQFEKGANNQLLELGCGTGLLWRMNAKRVPSSWEITLSDYSEAMIREAQKDLAGSGLNLRFRVINAEDINLPDGSFDRVIANNMLYHLADRRKALAEMKRVLKNDGIFYAATASVRNMAELKALLKPFHDGPPSQPVLGNFSLENGRAQLEAHFSRIELRKYDDALEITEAEPIVNYFLSCNSMTEDKVILKEEQVEEFRRCLKTKLAKEGKIVVSKDTGLFICRK
ncbi:MAG TPA: class I SAM-dependent methyltransferase [Firmicutes bacterium]|jgi:ubiquinone/menaquinone biosynthesis C-methylase UbiE|nr:class I SAM-dependent methyltransferase [Bacillota bacterium]